MLLSNHPQLAGGSHLPDITVITPVFSRGSVVFFVASRGHHADIGGISPGSMPPNSKLLAEEGAAVVSFKLVKDGAFQVGVGGDGWGVCEGGGRLRQLKCACCSGNMLFKLVKDGAFQVGVGVRRRGEATCGCACCSGNRGCSACMWLPALSPIFPVIPRPRQLLPLLVSSQPPAFPHPPKHTHA